MARTNETTQTLRMFLAEERPTAVCVMSTPNGGGLVEWIPRSLIAYARKERNADEPGARAPYVFTLPEWKIDQRGLWDFVTNDR
jgi:hypothetical protein